MKKHSPREKTKTKPKDITKSASFKAKLASYGYVVNHCFKAVADAPAGTTRQAMIDLILDTEKDLGRLKPGLNDPVLWHAEWHACMDRLVKMRRDAFDAERAERAKAKQHVNIFKPSMLVSLTSSKDGVDRGIYQISEPIKFDVTKPVKTRDGRKARIICTDRKNTDGRPILALVDYGHGVEAHYNFSKTGHVYADSDSGLDLVNVPTKREGWVVLLKPRGHFGQSIAETCRLVYKTYDEAWAQREDDDRHIAVIKITWEE